MDSKTFYTLSIFILVSYVYCLYIVAKYLWGHKIDSKFIFCTARIAL